MPNTFFAGRAIYDDKIDYIDFPRLFIEGGIIRFDAITSWEGVPRVAEVRAGVATKVGEIFTTDSIEYINAIGKPSGKRCKLQFALLDVREKQVEIEGAWIETGDHPFYGILKRSTVAKASR